MFKTPKDYKFDSIPMVPAGEYRITVNDLLDLKIFSNNGYRVIDMTSTFTPGNISSTIFYLVEKDGQVRLPVIGRVPIQGMTIREAQVMLEEKYSQFYKDPFIVIKITNKRVVVFPGRGGSGTVVTLENENTTLLEALAKAGGIAETGKAKRVKLIRNNNGKTEVLLIDLSTIEGANQGNLVLQSNDVLYIEPIRRISQGVLSEISPIVGILTSFLFVYSLFIKK
jgi:polysaccharide export outer membrane protein